MYPLLQILIHLPDNLINVVTSDISERNLLIPDCSNKLVIAHMVDVVSIEVTEAVP